MVGFASTDDARYQAMLNIIRDGRDTALSMPRVDMPGAEVLAGACRTFNPPPLPDGPVPLAATVGEDGVVSLSWERSARTLGLEAELHRSGEAGFTPNEKTLLTRTTLFKYTDALPPTGQQHYALVLVSATRKGSPSIVSVNVPPPAAPQTPRNLIAAPASGSVRLKWEASPGRAMAYHVFRGKAAGEMHQLTDEPVRGTTFVDGSAEPGVPHVYRIRAVSIRGLASDLSAAASAAARLVESPVFVATFAKDANAVAPAPSQADPKTPTVSLIPGKLHGKARVADGSLDLRQGGHVTFQHRPDFDLAQPLSVECRVRLERPGQCSVIASCGQWQHTGWFLQQLGGVWRWHVGGIDCDGGKVTPGEWTHLVATFDGRTTRLFQNGTQVAEKAGIVNTSPWPGELHIGQYSPGPAPGFQVTGQVAGVKIYHRALDAAEVTSAARATPQVVPPAAK